MRDFLITFFLGWLGIHRFMQKKYITGIIYFFTLGLCGFGWLYDAIAALTRMIKGTPQNSVAANEDIPKIQTGKRLVKSFDTVIVGTFAKCRLDPESKRQDVIAYVKPKWELFLEFFNYQGAPAYYVCHPNGTDIGCVKEGLAKILYEEYSDCEFKVTAISNFYDDRDNESYNIRIDLYK